LPEIVYFQDIFRNELAIAGAAAYIDNMLSNRNAYDSGSFGAAVDEICIFESVIKICSSVSSFDFPKIRILHSGFPAGFCIAFSMLTRANRRVTPTANQFLSDEEAEQFAEKIPRKGTTK